MDIVQRLKNRKLVVGLFALLFCGNVVLSLSLRTRGLMALTAFVFAMAVSLGLTALTRNFAIRRQLVDTTKSVRKVHVKAVPRLGGIAFVVAWYSAVGLALLLDPRFRQVLTERAPRSYMFLAGGIVVALVGALDDIYGLRARHKLAAEMAIAFLLCVSGFTVETVQLPTGGVLSLGILAVPFTMLWIIGVMNAMNLIDGLDGLAGGVAAIALGAVFFLCVCSSLSTFGMYAAALSGAVLGFLVYNFNPASIFMGDAGSLFLGYFLAVALLVCTRQPSTAALPLAVPILILGVPVADTLLAICRRALRGKGLFSPDREHLHHRLIKRGLSHRNAVLALYATCAVLASAAVALAFGTVLVDALVWVALAFGVVWAFRTFGFFDLEVAALRTERRRNLELRSAVSTIAGQIKSATELSEVLDSLSALSPAVSAEKVVAQLGSIPAEPRLVAQGEAIQMRFPLRHGRQDLGHLDVVWTDGRAGVEQDHALAIEELCSHVTRAVRRLSPELASPQALAEQPARTTRSVAS